MTRSYSLDLTGTEFHAVHVRDSVETGEVKFTLV